MTGRPRLLIFDLDGTLYSPAKLRRLLAPRLAGRSMRRPAEGWRAILILRAFRRALEELRGKELPRSLRQTQLELTCAATGYPRQAVEDCLEEWFETAPLPMLKRCVRPGLEELLGLGIPCAVFSDYDPAPKLAAMGLSDRFAMAICADDARVRVLKPDPRGLRVVLAEMGVEPREAVYLGDREEVDGAAARAAGMPFELIGEQGFLPLLGRIMKEYAR